MKTLSYMHDLVASDPMGVEMFIRVDQANSVFETTNEVCKLSPKDFREFRNFCIGVACERENENLRYLVWEIQDENFKPNDAKRKLLLKRRRNKGQARPKPKISNQEVMKQRLEELRKDFKGSEVESRYTGLKLFDELERVKPLTKLKTNCEQSEWEALGFDLYDFDLMVRAESMQIFSYLENKSEFQLREIRTRLGRSLDKRRKRNLKKFTELFNLPERLGEMFLSELKNKSCESGNDKKAKAAAIALGVWNDC